MDFELDSSYDDIITRKYELDECADWIVSNNFGAVFIETVDDDLKDANRIIQLLKSKASNRSSSAVDCEFYLVPLTSNCSVDYLAPQHLNNEQARKGIIRYGRVCLAPSSTANLPVFFSFGNDDDSTGYEFLKKELQDLKAKEFEKCLIVYKFDCLGFALKLYEKEILSTPDCWASTKFHLAKIRSRSKDWHFTSRIKDHIFIDYASNADAASQDISGQKRVGPYIIPEDIGDYDALIHIGSKSNQTLRLSSKLLFEIDPKQRTMRQLDGTKELRKRIAVIEASKQVEKFGIIFTNPLPRVDHAMENFKRMAKRAQKKLYFLNFMLTIDEYKLGNFAEIEAFVICNGCICSNISESFKYHKPILSSTEFAIVSGCPVKYGGIEWNASTGGDDLDDMNIDENQSREVIQSEVLSKNYSWYGLRVDAGEHEPSAMEKGLEGIPASYQTEPVQEKRMGK